MLIKMLRFIFSIIAILIALACGTNGTDKTVHVYCALDQVYSEPILKAFEQKTGIIVKAKYDVEAVKTVGLINAIIAEKDNPQCDVLWNNEVMHTINLKKKGLLLPYKSPSARSIPDQYKDLEGYWTGIAARARVIIYNTEKFPTGDLPDSIYDFLDPDFRNNAAIALPLFGTTATHASALFSLWGNEKAVDFFNKIKRNDIIIAPGNAVVKDRVAYGEIAFGLTDTDDANTAVLNGQPVGIIFPDQKTMGTLVLPNSIAVIHRCPHPQEAKMLVDYLLSPEVEEKLAYGRSAQIPLHTGVKRPQEIPAVEDVATMPVSYEDMADMYTTSLDALKEIFLK